ncbi:CCC motif membrane protein [Winogradskyella litorisediminis]|uniref:CCC motif membrane protein n=2 Tax=Winogradskyella litorisediminis TaxID=1156618 RepID=A0ABW3N3Z4_9FLAO
MYKSKLPAEPTALVLGIIGLVIGIASCCCYGITAIVPLGLSIAGLVMANKSLNAYKENPEAYERASYTNVSTAKVINLIAVIINSLIFLFAILILILYGSLFSTAMLESMRNGEFNSNDDYNYEEYDDYEWENDSTKIEVEEYSIEKEIDSINIDSIINE